MLEKLLLSINECNLNRLIIKDITIVVIDNDGEKTAESTVQAFGAADGKKFNLSYFSYPVKGLASVRNELLKRSFELTPDFIVFVDDDEYVAPEWLNELVKAIIDKDADVVRGPVKAINDASVPANISCWFKRESYPDGTQLFVLATNNLIMRRASIQKFDVWFDPRFNASGSEDTYFGIQLVKKGAKIYWATNAVVYEAIPKNRSNISWITKRIYRTASTFSYTLMLEHQFLLLTKKILVSFVYVIGGCLALILLLTNVKRKYWGLIKISEGIGGLSGAMNITYKEYKNI